MPEGETIREESITGNRTATIDKSVSQEESIEQFETCPPERQVQEPGLKTENMEVHHHPDLHHQPKRWKEYLLEFVMIFLAVTMGFFAENIRENTTNNEKEKHYIQSLAEDIKSDTTQLHNYIRFKTNVLRYCDSLLSVISHGNVFQNSDSFYTYSRELARYIRYYPADRTIEQLKNGYMHLISNWDVSNAISEYYSKTKFMEEVDQEMNDEELKYRRYLIEFLDLSSYDRTNEPGSYMSSNIQTKGNPAFIYADTGKIKIFYNEIFTLKAFLYNCNRSADELIKDASNLLELLHKEYRF